MSLELTRRQLLRAAAAAAVAWQARPWIVNLPAAAAQTPADDVSVIPTLEAYADTLIPGEKRGPDDRPIAGVADGPGAVQAGAIDLLHFPPAGVRDSLPGFAAGINTNAAAYAATHGIALDPTVPAFVSLGFAQRTEVVADLTSRPDPEALAWFALAGLCFLAYHTAGHLHTAEAVDDGHPGLAALGFPPPDDDGLWRFPEASYRRRLATEHPRTTPTGNPA